MVKTLLLLLVFGFVDLGIEFFISSRDLVILILIWVCKMGY